MNETDVEIVDQAPAQDLDPMEVISVEELLGRLAEEQEAAAEEEAVSEEEAEPEPLEVAGTDETIRLLESIQTQLTPHPFLTIPSRRGCCSCWSWPSLLAAASNC